MKYCLGENKVKIGANCYIAPNATLVGNVTLGDNVSVWFNAVARADANSITLGNNSNIQDCCVLHVTEKTPLIIGDNVNIGHKAMLHGCTIGNNVLIGINAVILDGAVIGDNCIIGANSLVTAGKVIPAGSLVMGSPAKVVRELDEKGLGEIPYSINFYLENRLRYLKELKPQED
jgi:carbonic anhydrase/acetyltransferase-like protein (isoleucine patch superfamily)